MLVYPYKHCHVITSVLDRVLVYSPLLPTPWGHSAAYQFAFWSITHTPTPARRHVNTVCCKQRSDAQTNIGDGLFLVQLRVACHKLRRRHSAFFNHGCVTLTTVSRRLFELQEQRSSPSEKPPSWHVTLERQLLACRWRGTSERLVAARHRVPILLYPDSPTIKTWHFPLETIWIIYYSRTVLLLFSLPALLHVHRFLFFLFFFLVFSPPKLFFDSSLLLLKMGMYCTPSKDRQNGEDKRNSLRGRGKKIWKEKWTSLSHSESTEWESKGKNHCS